MSWRDLPIFTEPDNGFGYKKCWICNKQKQPLKWIIYLGWRVHSCEDCIKEKVEK